MIYIIYAAGKCKEKAKLPAYIFYEVTFWCPVSTIYLLIFQINSSDIMMRRNMLYLFVQFEMLKWKYIVLNHILYGYDQVFLNSGGKNRLD